MSRFLAAAVSLLAIAAGEAAEVTVRGRLVDAATGDPIPGTIDVLTVPDDGARLVRQSAGAPAPPPRRVATSAAGAWSVSLPRGAVEHRLVAHAPGRRPVVVKDLVALGRDLTVDAVPLVTGGVLRGRVRLADGGPAAGARIELAPRDEGRQAYPPAVLETVTDADGSYRLEGVGARGGHLSIRAPGAAPWGRDIAGPVPPGAIAIDAELQAAVRVRGIVTDLASRPVAGAWVEELPSPPSASGGPATRTSADGTFTLSGLARGHALLQARAPGSRPGTWRGSLPRDGDAPIEIRLAPGGSLRVALFDETTGDAIEGARLSPDRRQLPAALTDPMGEACWESVPPDAILFDADARGYAVESIGPLHVPPGSDVVLSVAMRRTALLEGIVVDADGSPLGGVTVRAGRSRELQGGGHMPFVPLPRPGTETDGSGAFVLEDLEAAPVFLELRAPGLARKEVRLGSVAAGEVRRGMRLQMGPGGRLTGLVLDPDGRPAAGATVTARVFSPTPKGHARGEAAEPLARAVTGAGGAYELEALPRGAIEIQAARGTESARATAMAFPGETLTVDAISLPSPTGGPRVIEVVDAAGGHVPGAVVTASTPGGRTQTAVPDGPGRYLLPAVATDAPARVAISVPDMRRVEIDAPPGGARVVVAPAPRLAGRVVDAGGGPVTAFTLQVSGAEGSGFRTTLEVDDPDGQFDVAVEAGTVDLQVSAPGRLDAAARSVPVAELPGLTPPVWLEMTRGAAISGWLVDADGVPVDGGRVTTGAEDVTIRGRAYRVASQAAMTAADGSFRLSGLSPGTVAIQAEAPSHPTLSLHLPVERPGLQGVVLELPAGATLPGAVLLPDGSPARSARVTIYDGRRVLRRVATGESGELLVAGLPLGTFEIDAELVNGARSSREPLVVDRRDPALAIIRIRAGLTVEGRVLGAPEELLARITVLALSPRGSWTAAVEPDGTFALQDVAPGDVLVSATLPEDAGGRSVRRPVRVAWGETAATVELDFSAP